MAELVVARTLRLVREDVVGLLDFGEPLGCIGLLVHIGVQLPDELAMGIAYLRRICAFGDTENFVVIALAHEEIGEEPIGSIVRKGKYREQGFADAFRCSKGE
jgi:hypothetical protein